MKEVTPIYLENSHIKLCLTPCFGARVISLINKHTGRDWLVSGKVLGDSGKGAIYGGNQAKGWDECFPTVAPVHTSISPWPKPIRDHGELWGRPWSCVATENAIDACYQSHQFKFTRRITLVGNMLKLNYGVENLTAEPLPYLWSQHCLLATTTQDTISLAGSAALFHSTYCSDSNAPKNFPWPILHSSLPSLETIQKTDAKFALKAYSLVEGRLFVEIGHAGEYIQFEWADTDIPYVGIWLDYGGWPDDTPTHQVAIEPTTSASDDLSQAIRKQQAPFLEPEEQHNWSASISLLNKKTTSDEE